MTSGVALPASKGRRAVVTVAAALGLLLAGTSLQTNGAFAGGQLNGGQAAGGQSGVGTMAATQNVKLGLNKSVVIDLPADAYDILVANPAVADAVTRTARRIYLFGKAVGEPTSSSSGRTANRSSASTCRSSAIRPASRITSSALFRRPR